MAARNLALFLALLVAAPLPARAADASPDASRILAEALSPRQSYKAHVTLTRWQGGQMQAEQAAIYFRPPHTYRMEFLSPAGAIDRVVLTDGQREEIQFIQQGRTVANDARTFRAPLLTEDRLRSLLFTNYKIELVGTDQVLSRPVWVIQLTPLYPGKPQQRMLVDQASRVVMEVRRSGEESGSATVFTRFEPGAVSGDLFTWVGRAAPTAEMGSPTDGAADAVSHWPTTLPGGFSLLSSDRFEVDGHPIRHGRYSDGLSTLSVFETSVPVKSAEKLALPASASLGGHPLSTVEKWRSEGRYLTAIGEIPAVLFAQIRQDLR